MKKLLVPVLAGMVTAGLLSGPAMAQGKKTLAFVTNGSADFWTIARRGTEKAAKELPNYKVEFDIPSQATAASQKRLLDDLLTRGVAGVSISTINPANSTAELNKVASKAVLFSTDSDATASKRIVYIGTDNFASGVQAGHELKKVLPNGGDVMMFVGSMDNDNAIQRVNGIRKAIAGTKIKILGIRTDQLDAVAAKRNVEDTLAKYPHIAGLVGIYSYNTPQIYNAVKAAGKAGKVKIIGFDEDPQTLRGVADGTVYATIVQQPFQFGYQCMMDMAKYIQGDRSFIPANHQIIIPTRIIDKSNVKGFQGFMQKLLKG